MTPEQKQWIDNATYEMLLRKWRFSPSGEPMFQGECGAYYAQVMGVKRRQLSPADAAAVSKAVGWDEL